MNSDCDAMAGRSLPGDGYYGTERVCSKGSSVDCRRAWIVLRQYHAGVQVRLQGERVLAPEYAITDRCITFENTHQWKAACEAWLDESKPLDNAFDVSVNAVDLSPEALGYGKRRGIFDETFQHDFAKPYPPAIMAKLEEADFVTSIMTTFYIPTERWMEGCFKFLADRSKPKMLVYNVMLAFDQRNLSPELLFAGIPNWTAKSSFNKHRNMTKIEQESNHGCTEAWTTTYIVTFHPCQPHNPH